MTSQDAQTTQRGSADPNEVISRIIAIESANRSRIKAARAQVAQHQQATGQVVGDLTQRWVLTTETQRHLSAAGVSIATLAALHQKQAEFRRAGFLMKGVIGDQGQAIKTEGSLIAQRWREHGNRLDQADEAASRQRDEDILALKPAVEYLYSEELPVTSMLMTPAGRYAGADLHKIGVTGGLPHRMWIAEPIADAAWAAVPYLNHSRVATTWFPGRPGLSFEQACAGVRGMVIEQMSLAFPRRLQLTWIDPATRGGTAGPLLELLEIDKDLIDTQVWSEPDQIDAALRRISDHISYIEQRCLKDRFENIDVYNMQAGSLAEADRLVVVTGFPRNFTQQAIDRLTQIVKHGARTGVTVHLVLDEAVGRTVQVSEKLEYPMINTWSNGGFTQWNGDYMGGIPVFAVNGRAHAYIYSDYLDDAVGVPIVPLSLSGETARHIVEAYAQAAVQAAEVVVDSDELTTRDADSIADTAEEIVLPLGVMGRGDTLELRLGKGLAQNVLVGGLPGSGKSTLFHTIITSAIRRYDPSELELYLLDFKQGVEFQPYAVGQLPHARVVAVQSEREFGLSVLRSLRDEIDRRAQLFREASVGADSLKEYRLRTGERLPRLLLIVDEFQVLFADDDADATECLHLLDHIVRQGRAFGIHTILGTQTLRGHGHMTQLSGTLDQVAIRIVLKTSDTDSRRFLADDNPAGARLTRPGEAVFNPDGGRAEGNLVFQVALTADESRDGAIKAARLTADQDGFTRTPLVFDGTRAVNPTDDDAIATMVEGTRRPDKRAVHLHLGLPVSIHGDGAAHLWRRSGGHLLVLARDPVLGLGMLATGVSTALAAADGALDVVVVDNLGIDEDYADYLARLSTVLPDTRYSRRKMAAVLAEIAAEVEDRVSSEDYGRRRTLVVINALQRARELGEDTYFDSMDSGSPRAHFRAILRDGAEVGVHLLVAADAIESVDRRLGDTALAEFGSRLLTQCSSSASQRILGSERAANLGTAYALLSEPDDDRTEKIRPFPIPSEEWIAAAVARARRRS